MTYLSGMPGQFFHRVFGEAARSLQVRAGSRASYARHEAASDEKPDALTARELDFIAARDSLYLATVTPDGWPYVQHRGGPAGFIRHLGGNRLGFPNFPGNRQYVSSGNLLTDPRVALFCMDYRARRRLKLIGHARILGFGEDPALVAQLGGGGETVVAATIIDVVGFDWNCPQYITPRFTRAEIDREIDALRQENAALRAELERIEANQR